MTLNQLLNRKDLPFIEITGLTSDSRAVRKGFLFVALQGSVQDGRAFIEDAIRHGAKAILAPTGTVIPRCAQNLDEIAWIEDENPRHALALAAGRFFKQQPETIVAVTGTNGKTSTVSFVRQIWEKLNYRASSLGTLGLQGTGLPNTASMTTPDPIKLHAQLAELAQRGIDHLAIEASSHGIDQSRLDAVQISAAGFTNITHDHLDYHETMENYAAAKRRLFSDLLKSNGTAVINADSEEYEAFRTICESRGIRYWS